MYKTGSRFLGGVLLSVCLLLSGCAVKQEASAEQKKADEQLSIAVTSVAVMEICEKLELPLTGVPQSSLVTIPDCYAQAVLVGSPMSPDMEVLKSLSPDWVLSPASLISDLQPKYEAAGLSYAFLNLKSIAGMYRSIQELGVLLDCEEKANAMVEEFEQFMAAYQKTTKSSETPTVLILMGVPGSYVVATEHSYVGSLVEMAGGRNVYAGTEKEFLNVNTEDMLQKNPDIILRTAHALPEQVMEMFAEEFAGNDIWQHFEAVQEGKVYDLSNGYFGMSATFDYPEALAELSEIFAAQKEAK